MKIKGCKKVCMYFLSILVNIAQKLDGHYNNESITDNEKFHFWNVGILSFRFFLHL